MIVYETGAVKVEIDLKNGIYRLPVDGGVGKTYLFKILESLSISNNILCLTFGVCELKDITNGVVICDRFDLYQTKDMIMKLTKLSDNNVVLLSVKHLRYVDMKLPRSCNIYWESGEISVRY